MVRFGDLYKINFSWAHDTVLKVRVNDGITTLDMRVLEVLYKYKDSLVDFFIGNYVRLIVIENRGVKND